jgi:hypothetical protein
MSAYIRKTDGVYMYEYCAVALLRIVEMVALHEQNL